MSNMIEMRLPERLQRELVRRAGSKGVTVTEYILAVLEREVSRSAPAEVFRRIAGREPVRLGRPAAELIGEERSRRGR